MGSEMCIRDRATGEPLRFIQDISYAKWRRATLYYYYNWILNIDEPVIKKVILWGSIRDLRRNRSLKTKFLNWLSNTIFLNCFRMTERDIKRYIKIINSYKPDLIRGYAGALYELCRYAERKHIRLHRPKVVIAAAETLYNEMREAIEGRFQTKVYNFYGSRELGPIAGECSEGLMHIFSFNNYVEILDRNNMRVDEEGAKGKIIVTNLHNYSMPFIRYEIGDIATVGPKKCKCGNLLPTLLHVDGRIIEHFVREDGTFVPGEFFIHVIGVVHNKGFIRKFKVIQEDFKKIRILVIPEKKINNHIKENIENEIKMVMGQDVQIIWELVDDIPKTSEGKFLYTKSLVWK